MSKTFLVTTLILAVIAGTACTDCAEKNSINYKKVEAFMKDYYHACNLNVQDAERIDKMDEYYAQNFIVTSYLPLPEYPVMDLNTWKKFLVKIHIDTLETLQCLEMSIDTKKMTVFSRLISEFKDRKTGDSLLKVDCIDFYEFEVNKENKIKLTSLKIFFSDPVAIMKLAFPPDDR